MCVRCGSWQPLRRDGLSHSGPRAARIEQVLRARFAPVRLAIVDESARHAGHAERVGLADGETHFQVTLVAAGFAGMSRVARSRAVHEALAGEFAGGLHALSLTLAAPQEG
jgi:stress-induced morphogen